MTIGIYVTLSFHFAVAVDNKKLPPLVHTISYCYFISLCILSRIYLVVELFTSLRNVPIGVFAALPWVQNIPHI